MAFVGDDDFIIPPFKLKFFDIKTKQIETISTNEINIKVTGVKKDQSITIKRPDVKSEEQPLKTLKTKQTNSSKSMLILVFLAGLACGIVLMMLKSYRFSKKTKNTGYKRP